MEAPSWGLGVFLPVEALVGRLGAPFAARSGIDQRRSPRSARGPGEGVIRRQETCSPANVSGVCDGWVGRQGCSVDGSRRRKPVKGTGCGVGREAVSSLTATFGLLITWYFLQLDLRFGIMQAPYLRLFRRRMIVR